VGIGLGTGPAIRPQDLNSPRLLQKFLFSSHLAGKEIKKKMFQQSVAAVTQRNLKSRNLKSRNLYIYSYLIFKPFDCIVKILLPEQHSPIAVPGRDKVL
jgi:hypothetical protein